MNDALISGRQGEPGRRGNAGLPGIDGQAGFRGRPGIPGELGQVGDRGFPGMFVCIIGHFYVLLLSSVISLFDHIK